MLDLFFPQRCVVCRRSGEQLCSACRSSLRRIPPPWCERCGAPTTWPVRRCGECAGRRLAFASARAAIVYDDHARTVIRAWKERGLRRLVEQAAEIVVEALPRPAADELSFVPPDRERSLARGHHPAAALANELGDIWGIPVRALLRRAADSRRQTGLPLSERRANLTGTFAPAGPARMRVCLVDDVYTSGTTAHAAASALRKGGAGTIEVVTLARAVR